MLLRKVNCLEEHVSVQAQTGETAVTQQPLEQPCYWSFAGNEWVAKAAQPSPLYVFDWSTYTWSDPRPLDEKRAQKIAEIKAIRDAKITEPKVTSYGTFDSTDKAQNDLSKVIQMLTISVALGTGNTANFTLSDNTRPSFTLVELQTAALQMGAQVQALFDIASTLRSQIETATEAELESITWPAT
jgi:hypothetical protein